MPANTIIVVCGLSQEARIARGHGVAAVAGGGRSAGLADKLAGLDPAACAAVVSFGLAGALDPALPVAAIALPRTVLFDGQAYATSDRIRTRWADRLAATGEQHSDASLAGSDTPLLTAREKARLRAETGGAVVDMESHVAAVFAARHGLPFAALRVISDGPDRDLPLVAAAAMRPDGSVDILGVLGGLARDPGQIPALIRTARDAGAAFRTLRRVRGLLDDLLRLDL